MTTELATRTLTAEVMESVIIEGDLSKLSPAERVDYYHAVCRSLGLNPLTKPFQYLRLNNKLVLYAMRDATEQLRRLHNISTQIMAREWLQDLYIVTARAIMPDGRTDESVGAVPVTNLKGEALANAIMKAETKAKRRVTLSINGLGFLDETEVDSIPNARIIPVDPISGALPEPRQEGHRIDVQPPEEDEPTQRPVIDPVDALRESVRTWNHDHANEVIGTEEILRGLDVLFEIKTKNAPEGVSLLKPEQLLEMQGLIARGEYFKAMEEGLPW